MSTILADPLGPPADEDQLPASARPRRRWEVWRSPDDQPAWARPALLGVAAAAAVLYAWNITRAGYAPFYSVAVKSMSESWKAFFYGAFDPQATSRSTSWPGRSSRRRCPRAIFGFSAWSLALPQFIEGIVSVLVMYRVVRRWAGTSPGLLAAGLFALTPIAASMFGHSMEDGALTMCLVLAADAYQRAVFEARLRSLILAGVWVGLGFQAKMLQAWMVLPALAVGYLVAAPVGLRRGLWQLAWRGSSCWRCPCRGSPSTPSLRPATGPTSTATNNSAVASVFGYNGLERFGINVKGAVTSGPGVTTGGTGGAGEPARHRSDQEPGRLRNHRGRSGGAFPQAPQAVRVLRRGLLRAPARRPAGNAQRQHVGPPHACRRDDRRRRRSRCIPEFRGGAAPAAARRRPGGSGFG